MWCIKSGAAERFAFRAGPLPSHDAGVSVEHERWRTIEVHFNSLFEWRTNSANRIYTMPTTRVLFSILRIAAIPFNFNWIRQLLCVWPWVCASGRLPGVSRRVESHCFLHRRFDAIATQFFLLVCWFFHVREVLSLDRRCVRGTRITIGASGVIGSAEC